MAENDSVLRSILASRLRWDVFLSFRGADTRDIFTEHLYAELERNGVRVFRDNDGLRSGDSLDPTLFEAIEDSAASIAIISPNYASSRWCLEELTKICECSAEYRLILPVFYGVDPSDVRRQTGPFEAHFLKHKSRYGEEVVGKWREAMRKVGGISGWVYTSRHILYFLSLSLNRSFLLSITPNSSFRVRG